MIDISKILTMMESQGIAKSRLKVDKIVGGKSYDIIIKAMNGGDSSGITLKSIDAICRYLNCQPGDIMEYIPDQPNADPEAAPLDI